MLASSERQRHVRSPARFRAESAARRDHVGLPAAGARMPAAADRARRRCRPGPWRARRRWRGGWSSALREKSRGGGVEGLIHEYSLASEEGVALMCLAEALLRIPDDDTRDALIRDKIGGGDWRRPSRPQPVAVRERRDLGPAADRPADGDAAASAGLSAALARLIGEGRRAADPHRRQHRHAPDGRAVRRRPDDRRGARQRPRPWRRRASAIPTTCWARRR